MFFLGCWFDNKKKNTNKQTTTKLNKTKERKFKIK